MNLGDNNILSDIKIVEFDFSNKELIEKTISILNKGSKKKVHNLAFWDWRFNKNPFAKPLGWCAIDVKKNELASVLLWWPWGFFSKGKTELFYQAINAKTEKEYQRIGLFYKLNKIAIEYFESNGIRLYGYPNELSMPNYKKIGWYVYPELKPEIIPISFLNLFTLNKKANDLIRNIEVASIPLDFKIPEQSNDIPQTKWTADLINWRFIEHPNYRYSIYLNNNNILVYRILKRGFLREAKIIMTIINKKFSYKDFKRHLKNKGVNFFTYVGRNSFFEETLSNKLFKARLNKKLYFTHNASPDLSLRFELAESDSQ